MVTLLSVPTPIRMYAVDIEGSKAYAKAICKAGETSRHCWPLIFVGGWSFGLGPSACGGAHGKHARSHFMALYNQSTLACNGPYRHHHRGGAE